MNMVTPVIVPVDAEFSKCQEHTGMCVNVKHLLKEQDTMWTSIIKLRERMDKIILLLVANLVGIVVLLLDKVLKQ